MSCRELNEQISLYLDGLLHPTQLRKLEEHSEICENCQHKLTLMREIPTALRTDRMLAPRQDFTAIVMQQVVISQHFKVNNTSGRGGAATAEPETQNDVPAKVISLPERRSNRMTYKSPADYMLRFASMAAALVFIFGAGVYVTGTSAVDNSTKATVSSAISDFAALLVDSVQSPPIVAVGVLLAAAIVVLTWWYIKRTTSN